MKPLSLSSSAFLAVLALGFGAAPLEAIIDQDGDGISDVWSALFPFSGSATADPDGDGATNFAEAVAGTNPADPASHPACTLETAAGFFIVRWQGVPGKLYRIEESTDLTHWAALPSTYQGTGAEIPALVAGPGTPGARSFWRTTVQDLDSDDDGVSNWEEVELGTDPNSQADGLIWDQRRWDRAVWE